MQLTVHPEQRCPLHSRKYKNCCLREKKRLQVIDRVPQKGVNHFDQWTGAEPSAGIVYLGVLVKSDSTPQHDQLDSLFRSAHFPESMEFNGKTLSRVVDEEIAIQMISCASLEQPGEIFTLIRVPYKLS